MRKFKKQMGVLLAAALVAGSTVPVSAEDVPANLEGEQTTAETQEEQRPEETTGETEETEVADREETASPEESAGEAEETETTDGKETSFPEESTGEAEGSETSRPEESADTADTADTEEKPAGQQRPGEITGENSGTEATDSKKDSQPEKTGEKIETKAEPRGGAPDYPPNTERAYPAIGGNIYYAPTWDGKEIGVAGCDKSVTEVEILEEIDGLPVTCIFYGAFDGCSSLKSVAIPASVDFIRYWAFYGCSSLESINIPYGVPDIGSSTFDGCSSLKSIEIPDTVTSLGFAAFRDCSSLESVAIPDGVISIEEYAFDGCTSLKSVDIPNSVTSIEENAFSNCDSLKEIIFKGTIAEWNSIKIGEHAIPGHTTVICNDGTVGNIKYQVSGGYIYLDPDSGEIVYCDKSVTEVDIPNEIEGIAVTSIGYTAFDQCKSLESITIPEGVISIGTLAFQLCDSLKNVTIPNGVISIGGSAFNLCSSLESVTIPNSVTIIEEHAFFQCGSLKDIDYSEGTKEQWNNIKIGNNAIPEHTTVHCSDGDIGNVKYQVAGGYIYFDPDSGEIVYCDKSVTEANIPSKIEGTEVTAIRERAFYNSYSLKSVTIPNGVTSIGDYAFYFCGPLKSITIPDSMTFIGESAFAHDDRLEDIYFSGTEEQWDQISIGGSNDPLKSAVIHFESDGPKSYAVTVPEQPTGGTVTLSASSAQKGDTVTVSVVCDRGYRIKSVTVLDGENKNVSVRRVGKGEYSFTMPESDVTIQAILQKESSSGSSSSSSSSDTSNSYESVDTYEDSSDDADSSSSSSRSSGATILIHGAGSSTVTAVTADSVTKAIRQSAGTGTTASVSITDTAKITKEVLGKMTAPVTFKGTGYQVTIDPAKMTEKLDIQLGVKPSAPTAQKTFEKFFQEPVATISCAQQGEYGGNVYIDIKPDKWSNLDLSKTVYVYSWNPVTNTYKRVGTAVRLSNGWIRCYTTRGYDLILSNSDTFTRK